MPMGETTPDSSPVGRAAALGAERGVGTGIRSLEGSTVRAMKSKPPTEIIQPQKVMTCANSNTEKNK